MLPEIRLENADLNVICSLARFSAPADIVVEHEEFICLGQNHLYLSATMPF